MALTRRKVPKKITYPSMKPGPWPKMSSIKDPKIVGTRLVKYEDRPDHPDFPKMDPFMVVPGTYYRIDTDKHEVISFVTVLPGGTLVAWSTCRVCSRDMRVCACPRGVTTCRSVEYIYDQAVADKAGEPWSIHHTNYTGSLTKMARALRKPATPSLPPVIRSTPVRSAPVQPEAPKPRRSLKPVTQPAVHSGPMAKMKTDYDDAAQKGSDDLEKQFNAVVKKTGGLTRRKTNTNKERK